MFTCGPETSAVETARQALAYAKDRQKDLVIFDTAGRLHIDEALMQELQQMKDLVVPDEILLTVDAMTGQDIVTVAKEFSERLSVTGLIVTKWMAMHVVVDCYQFVLSQTYLYYLCQW